MLDYIQQHIKIVLIVGIIILLGLVGILFFVSRKQTTTNTNTNNGLSKDGFIIDSTNQFLEDNNISDEDKYLMLLGQNMTEDYGTSISGNTLPLYDLLNQSSSDFGTKVQLMIESIDKVKNVSTKVDPGSIRVNKTNNSSVIVTMNAAVTDNTTKKTTNITSQVDFIYQGSYWLVDNITFVNR